MLGFKHARCDPLCLYGSNPCQPRLRLAIGTSSSRHSHAGTPTLRISASRSFLSFKTSVCFHSFGKILSLSLSLSAPISGAPSVRPTTVKDVHDNAVRVYERAKKSRDELGNLKSNAAPALNILRTGSLLRTCLPRPASREEVRARKGVRGSVRRARLTARGRPSRKVRQAQRHLGLHPLRSAPPRSRISLCCPLPHASPPHPASASESDRRMFVERFVNSEIKVPQHFSEFGSRK